MIRPVESVVAMTGRVKVLSWQLEVVCISDRGELTIPGSLALQSGGFNLSNFGKRGIFGDVFQTDLCIDKDSSTKKVDMVPTLRPLGASAVGPTSRDGCGELPELPMCKYAIFGASLPILHPWVVLLPDPEG